jgi:GNAT superfamily N-acetyltransferase
MIIDFRTATSSDEKVLTSLREEFTAGEMLPNPLDAETNRRVLLTLIGNIQFGRIWLIECDRETLGYIILTFGFSLEYSGRDALIDELFLRERFRGFGIGRQAIDFVAEFCLAEGIRVIHLEVEQGNEAAKGLYHKTGFVDYKRYFLTKWIKAKV